MSHKNTILIVDDEPVGRRILEVLLSDQGYTFVTASNGEEALTQAAAFMPDLILLDIMMPRMDGFEVCQRLRADPLLAEVPVVMVTALDDRDSRLRGIEVGADDFISKPIDRVEVRKRVQTIMRLDRYRRLLIEREQRQQAEEEMRRRNRELTLLNTVISTAASTLDADAVLHIGCQALAQAFELPCAVALMLEDEQSCQAHVVACYTAHADTPPPTEAPDHRHNARTTLLLDETPALVTLVHDKATIAIADAPTDPRSTGLNGLALEPSVASILLVPLLIRDSVIGCIILYAATPREFPGDDFALAQSVATAVGQSLETANLYQRLQRYADHLEDTVRQRTLELQAERDRTQAILEALGEAVIVTDREGIIQYVNPATTELTGFRAEQMVGQNWHILQSGEQSSEHYQQIQACVQSGKAWRGEVMQTHQDGTTYDTAMTVAPIFDPHTRDTLIGIVSVQRDVTPLKEAERLKDQFVSNVSHELRTPLSIITLLSGNLDTLFDRLNPDKRRSMVRDIREHAQVLNDLISSVLEISRIDGRRISTQYQPLNLVQLVREELERQHPLSHKKKQSLQIIGTDRLMAWGNDGQLRQVIRNLLNNAIKYTPAGGQIVCECQPHESLNQLPPGQELQFWSVLPPHTPNVWPGSDCLPADRWAALRVVDNGIGISPDDLPHIFERFYRVQTQGNVPGTGLGLSIAQELVEMHGGHLAIASRPDHGCIIAIYLPLMEDTTL
jgi:PAS domain S-box-containing protein